MSSWLPRPFPVVCVQNQREKNKRQPTGVADTRLKSAGFGTKGDHTIFFVVFRFVFGRPIHLNIRRLIHIARPQTANFPWSGSRQALQPHHIGDHFRQLWKCLVHDGIVNAGDSVCFAGFATTLFQTRQRFERQWNRLADQFFLRGPGEHPRQTADLLVDVLSRPIKFRNHVIAQFVQRNGSKVFQKRSRMMLAEKSNDVIDDRGFPRDLVVLAVVAVGMPPVDQHQLVDGQR